MKNLRVNWRKVVALGTSVALIGGASALAIKKRINYNDGTGENTVGYEDFKYLFTDSSVALINDIRENNFLVLDVGDHNSVRVHFQDSKMKYCNDKDISLGIVVSTDSEDENQIYDDVDYVKGIIRDYNIDFPVYLNINEIIENDKLNVEAKTKIINDFLEKCSSNNIYVGIYGTDTNLCRAKKYCGISNYDAFVVMDKEKIGYNGTCNIIKDLDGNITSSMDLYNSIKDKGLNTKDGLVKDGTYIIKESDNILDIAMKYGFSVEELLEFNDIRKDDLVLDTELRIPSIIDKRIPLVDFTFSKLETPIRGCDMSYAQGSNSNWEKLADNFEFIILKCSQGLREDVCFDLNAKKCSEYNIPIGAYCYNDFTKVNCENLEQFQKNQKAQADFVIQKLKNKKIDYPVYLDIEGAKDLSTILDKKQVVSMLKIWFKKISEVGYVPGVYCNQTAFNYIQSCVDYDLADKFQVWIAGGDQYMSEKTDNIELDEVVSSSVLDKDYGAAIAQSTNVATNAGAKDGKGHLDINFSTIDYTKKKYVNSFGLEEDLLIKEFDRYDNDLIGGGVLGGVILLGGIGIGVYKRKKKNKQYIRK